MYGTIEDLRSYATARGDNAPTAASDADATAALTRASDMIRLRYVPNLLTGYGVDFTPDGSDLPLVEEAAYIAASLELATPGFFSKTFTASEQKVLTEVKGIKWTVVGKAAGIYAAMPVSTLIEALFEPYVIDRNADGFMFKSIGPGVCV
jgi:hypothetical protein